MTVLRLERLAAGLLDPVLALLGPALLARSGGIVFLTVADPECLRAERLLAHAGIRATSALGSPAPPRSLVAASGRSLVPAASVVHDAVLVRNVPLGQACVALVSRPWVWRQRTQRRARCRALLAGAESAYVWSRQAWASAAALRDPAVRDVLRPIVFDRATDEPPAPTHLGYAMDGALERWAFPEQWALPERPAFP